MVEDCGPCQSRRRRRRNPGQGEVIAVPFGGEARPIEDDEDSIAVLSSGWTVDTNGEAPRAGDEWGS